MSAEEKALGDARRAARAQLVAKLRHAARACELAALELAYDEVRSNAAEQHLASVLRLTGALRELDEVDRAHGRA